MHILSRQVRFSIDPFLPQQEGYNSYSSKPAGGDGLSLYLALWVDLASELNPDTGFVVNVSAIDKLVRQTVIPRFVETIQSYFKFKKTPQLWDMAALLRNCLPLVEAGFPDKKLKQLKLELNPYRSIILRAEDADMFVYSEKFEFAAMHRLWNDAFDDVANYEMFGKCANPAGHGHNYIIEVRVESRIEDISEGWIGEYQRVVKEFFVDIVDHKNLNLDVSGFETRNPTVENLSQFAWEKLAGKFSGCRLYKVILWENDRTYCSYCGPETDY